MREEIEMLENHAHLLPVLVNIQLFPICAFFLRDIHALENNGAGSRFFQKIQGAQKGALPRSRFPNYHHYIPFVDVDGDPVECFDFPAFIILFQVFYFNQFIEHLHGASSFPEQQQAC